MDKPVETAANQAVAEGGAYEIIHKRLLEHSHVLSQKTQTLNQQREQEFGASGMALSGRVRVRTANNCVPRDIVRIGDYLLFGYNVFIGLKKTTQISDVFSLYELKQDENEHYDIHAVSVQHSLLDETGFVKDFHDLYAYYKHAHLLQLQVQQQTLFASFQIGHTVDDIRVFRWHIDGDGVATYIDDRGERDIATPPSYDFEWHETTRDDQISGNHPHISILDEVFVETIGGTLTIKVEDNTEDGFGIYQEDVEDKHQALDDASIFYAKTGELILLKIRPYREQQWRFLVFNTLNKAIKRIDAIEQACVQLPEDHGLIFPGGYYLQNGENKAFDDNVQGLRFLRKVRSPNGEDVLYIFYEAVEGRCVLLSYNLIRKTLEKPIYGHGYTLYENGQALVFRSESNDPVRVHPMQIWQTPFCSDEHASATIVAPSFLQKIGNAELVKGISELYSINHAINDQQVSVPLYEALVAMCQRLLDSFYWLEADEVDHIETTVKNIIDTAELVLDEFEKVISIQQQADQALHEATLTQQKIIKDIQSSQWHSPLQFVDGLTQLQRLRGHLLTLREQRYIDLQQIDQLNNVLNREQDALSKKTVTFLSQDNALAEYIETTLNLQHDIDQTETVAELTPLLQRADELSQGLDLLTEILGRLKVDNAIQRTAILESISAVYGKINQVKAQTKLKKKALGSQEAVAEFAAQIALFSQSITGALGIADTPDKCDEQLSRLLIQLEEIEGQFSEYDEFLTDILTKREALYEAFETRKQALMDERQHRAQQLATAAERIITGVQRRSLKLTEPDELNTYFSSDPMVQKVRDIAMQLRQLVEVVRADDIDTQLKTAQEQAIRALRDKTDIFEDGGQIIKLGRHRFSVNTQPLDLTIVTKDDQQVLHLTGTDFFEPLDHPPLNALGQYWQQRLISETPTVYRAEYLAALILQTAEKKTQDLSLSRLLEAALVEGELLKIVHQFASPRYQEGYEKGVHDHDCVIILKALLPVLDAAGLLRYRPDSRALAMVFWVKYPQATQKETWTARANSAKQLADSLASTEALDTLSQDICQALEKFIEDNRGLSFSAFDCRIASEYLAKELAETTQGFVASCYARDLVQAMQTHLDNIGHQHQYTQTLADLNNQVSEQWQLSEAWLKAYVHFNQSEHLRRYIPEAAAILMTTTTTTAQVERYHNDIELQFTVSGLIGDHPLIQQQCLVIGVDAFLERMSHYMAIEVPAYLNFQKIRQQILDEERNQLQLEQFRAKPLASFVRNKLINEAYLPMIGDNLAKQMGTAGDTKRTDLMGMLLIISPPGYGKTTLMEYIANRLGLIFMKINCPSLGHEVRAIDPANAPNATAKLELHKLNLALEMGNNVMLYLDDIQHTHPEFLQKFIALCDGTRRIEGVWKNQTKTYDMRGKKFCVVMAGNPYTESGELFKIPDMLANRADVYNLGDILSGQAEIFSLSYIENTLTSNTVLAPLAIRDMADVYQLIRMAKGENIPSTDLNHPYSTAEIQEIIQVLQRLFKIQAIISKVNQAYIESAASADNYRTEPIFKLQGSYRNMNKMAEKVVAIMDESELQALITDHYQGEAQLLTTGAEENLLKLAELRGNLTPEQTQRWQTIKQDFLRLKSIGGDDKDVGLKIVNQMALISQHIEAIHTSLNQDNDHDHGLNKVSQQMTMLQQAIETSKTTVQVINEPLPGLETAFAKLADTIDNSLMPVVTAMNHKINLDLNILSKITDLANDLREFKSSQQSVITQHSD